MKFNIVKLVGVAAGVSMLALPFSLNAQEQAGTTQAKPNVSQYTFEDLGTLGGGFSQAVFVNEFGALGGISLLSNGDQHAFVWQGGPMNDLGTLGGHNSVDFGSPNNLGQIVGESETSASDPKGEDYCGFGTHLVCQALVWEPASYKKWAMVPLPNLKGGINSQATWLNDRGEFVGSSENGVADSTCPGASIAPQLAEFKPVVWYKPFSWFPAVVSALPTPKGDPDGVALSVNNEGHVVGSTGSCGTFNPNQFTNLSQVLDSHAVLWKDGRIIDLKGNGGSLGNTAFAVNDFDQVVGVSDLEGDANFHAFLWENGNVTDLKPIDGDANSVGLGINRRGQIAGLSLDADFNLRAVLWQVGSDKPTDLTAMATSDSTIIPFVAEWINDKGDIVGWGLEPISGEIHAFLAISNPGKMSEHKEWPKIHLSDSARRQILEHIKMGKSAVQASGQNLK